MSDKPLLLISGRKNLFEEGFNGCGVYALSGLKDTEEVKRPVYIGSSGNLRRRVWKEHFAQLANGTHKNSLIRRYYEKYKADNLVAFQIEECRKEDLKDREQFYIDIYGTSKGSRSFNIAPTSTGPAGIEMSEEIRERMRISHESIMTRYTFISPIGELITGKNLNLLCKNNGLSNRALLRVLKGKALSHKGWTTPEGRIKFLESFREGRKVKQDNSSQYNFISPDGKIYKGNNITKFCKEKNLSYTMMYKLKRAYRGRSDYNGWTRGDDE